MVGVEDEDGEIRGAREAGWLADGPEGGEVGVLGVGMKLRWGWGEEWGKRGNSGSRLVPLLGSTTGKGKAGCSSCPCWLQ